MNTKDRLLQFLEYIGMGQTAFESKVGWSRGHISKIKGAIGSDMIAKIVENFPELSIEWLIAGKGEMLKSQIHGGNIKNVGGDVSGNIVNTAGNVVHIPNFNGQKIIEPDGKVELYGDAQSTIEKLEIEKKALQQRIVDLEKMIDMKDKIILMLENNFKNCE